MLTSMVFYSIMYMEGRGKGSQQKKEFGKTLDRTETPWYNVYRR